MSGKIAQNPNRQSGVIGSVPSATKSASDPLYNTNPASGLGSEWINTTDGEIFLCTDATADDNVWVGQLGGVVRSERGVWYGGEKTGGRSGEVDYITINTTGNATNWATYTELTCVGGGSNGSNDRGVFAGGKADAGEVNTIAYFNISTSTFSAADFGDLTQARRSTYAASNLTNERIVWMGGEASGSSRVQTMDYITVNSPGDATDFGDIASPGRRSGGCTSNGTDDRGVYGGGYSGSNVQAIVYITISTTGDSSSFGDLLAASYGQQMAAVSNYTNQRAVFLGGNDPSTNNVLQYITINSTGNAADFGDYTIAVSNIGGLSNGLGERGVFAGGGDPLDQIGYITINSLGNGTDFGDLSIAVQEPAAVSNAG